MEAPERNLALDLIRVTEAAALASARWLGRGDKHTGDQAAVDAMRTTLNSLNINGRIVVGEGAKHETPVLYTGEKVGTGKGPALDVAADPVDGTRLLAFGRPNAVSLVAAAPADSIFDPGPSNYMKKLVVGPAAKGAADIEAPIGENLLRIAKALEKDVDDLVVFILDRPRHKLLVEEVRQAGARIQLHPDGDVAGALMAVDRRSEVDVMLGTGGTPEAVLAACAIRGMGGQMFCQFDPLSTVEKHALMEVGYDVRSIHTAETLIKSDDVFFALTGISSGQFIKGVRYSGHGAITHSMAIRGKTGTVRYVESHHNWDKLMPISAVKYD